MEKPKRTEQHERIARLAGTWVGEERIHESPSGPARATNGRYQHRVVCDGFVVVGDYWQMPHGANEVDYTGFGVFGVDPATQETTWYWVDSMGHPPAAPVRGRWDGERLTLLGHDAHGKVRSRYVFAFEGSERFRFGIEHTHDDGKSWRAFMEASYSKTAP